MIRLEHIYKRFETRGRPVHTALSDVNLGIERGAIYGIIGRSGAGKSTLIRLLNLLERPSSGKVYFNDEDISAFRGAQLRQLRHRIGMVFQHFNLLSSRTVLDNVCLPLRLLGVAKQDREARALELLEIVGLTEHRHKYPAQLSGGQKQRVGIARALANNPELLLCDEATSALDPETTQAILALLKDINQRLGITIVLITHSMDVIRSVCDRVAVLDQGHLVEEGEVIDVFLHPQHQTTQSLLQESSGVDAQAWKRLVKDSGAQVLRLSYRGESTSQPIISHLSRELGVQVSILQGTVGQLKDTAYGQLVVSIDGDAAQKAQVMQFLTENNVAYEVLES
ncbi:Methionine import ATP-binding protein MetN [Oligella urethralis]|uniref:methionine ABC transporter ATP-binding protein n=1 Tax=Oligella urethralis TaxID=90245 RepID=UPI00295882D0|nr:methionine ABC transporter ATP-binding protein [Oligella urethralis]WOS38736.1 Methionine import ATP-binding protein MetN [Oligella urethralis]